MSIFIYNSLPLVMAHGICAIANVMKKRGIYRENCRMIPRIYGHSKPPSIRIKPLSVYEL